jgi:hypothetical protein
MDNEKQNKINTALVKDAVALMYVYVLFGGPGSSVGIARGYGLDGPGIESRWGGEIFRTCPDRPQGPPSLLYNGYRVFPGGRKRPGRDAGPSSPSSAEVQKQSTAIPLCSLRAFVACKKSETYHMCCSVREGKRPLTQIILNLI